MSEPDVTFRTQPDPANDLGLAVAVFPGGGYRMIADHEAAPVARWFASIGVSAAVVDYPVGQPHPAPFRSALRVLDALRAEPSWRMRRVGVVGFSAGGHLAAMCCHRSEYGAPGPRPDFAVLCYPVIAMDEQGHDGSTAVLLGAVPDERARHHFSVDTVVGQQTPPTFLWHTADDPSVPVANSLRYAAACRTAGVPVELHVFEHGRHGLGLAEQTQAAAWRDLCASWLVRRVGGRTVSHPPDRPEDPGAAAG